MPQLMKHDFVSEFPLMPWLINFEQALNIGDVHQKTQGVIVVESGGDEGRKKKQF